VTRSSVVGVGSTRTRANVLKKFAYIQMLGRYNWEVAPRHQPQPDPEPEPPKPESPKRKKRHVQIEIHDPPDSPCPLPAPQPKVLDKEPPAKSKVRWIVIASACCLFVTGAVVGYGVCYIV
jgi:hypothetical protein